MCLRRLFGENDCTMLLFFVIVLLILCGGDDNNGCGCERERGHCC